MASPNGGRWVFSIADQPVVLGINNGIAPVFPQAQAGALNIEVFTNPTVAAGPVPVPDPDFVLSIADAGGTIEDNFLTGASLQLGNGDYLAVDSVTGAATQSPSQIMLGGGQQTVVGAKFDTLIGGSGDQILSALLGNETVIGGTGNESIWGGANDSIFAIGGYLNASQLQIVVTGVGSTVRVGTVGSATISAAAQTTIQGMVPPPNTAADTPINRIAIAAGQNNLIDLTGLPRDNPLAVVIGASGDTINLGSGSTNIEGAAGGMLINLGVGAATTALSGSTGTVAGNTVIGGTGSAKFSAAPAAASANSELTFNPSATAGKGDLIDLSGTNFMASINAFSFQSTRVVSPDTILATSNADSIFGGDGDRIGTASGTGSNSIVGGTHQWVHGDTVPGATIGFGSNDTVSSTTYDTVGQTATRGTVPGTSSADVTVGGFDTTSDFLFYQNETPDMTASIIATSQVTRISGTTSTIITLPDGTVMTLLGVSRLELTPALFKP